MASETFSYMCSLFRGVETFVGIKNDELGSGANHHTPEFDLDEDGLTYGTAAAVSYVLEYFENTPDTSAFEPAYNSISKTDRHIWSTARKFRIYGFDAEQQQFRN